MLPATQRPVYSCIAVTARRGVRAWVWGLGGYTGWVIRGHTGTQHAARGASLTAKRAPEAPARGLEWVVRCSGRVSPGPPSGPGRYTPGIPPCPGYPLSSQTAVQTRKTVKTVSKQCQIVKTAECHRNMSIRPLIVPISKTGLKSQLLDF